MPDNNKIKDIDGGRDDEKNLINIQNEDFLLTDDEDDDADEDIKPKEQPPINRFLTHQPMKYGKKFYIGEFLAEKFIQIVAFLSIGIIIAIFFYVFREASYAFIDHSKKTEQTAVVRETDDPSGELKPESYAAEPGEELKPESYGGVETTPQPPDNSGELKPETYGGVETTEDFKPESYGGVDSSPAPGETGVEPDNAASVDVPDVEKPVTITDLVMPNDTINGNPEHIWQPIGQRPKYSFIPLFLGALKVTSISIFIAAPIAILAAIFTVAFAPRWLREIMKPAIEILAGFPSVVIGFFSLMILASVIQDIFGVTYRLNSFVGGVGMALAVIPIIYTVTEDALSAVPKYMKEASLALGASRWQTAYRVVLPAATPGVFAAILLGFGRAFGETMIALMATGNAALVTWDLFDSVRTMSATIGAEMAEVEFQGIHYGVLFLIGAILFVVTFSLNAIAEFYVRKRLMKKFQGA